MKLRCFKNLVVADSMLIMKGDLIEDFIESLNPTEEEEAAVTNDIVEIERAKMDKPIVDALS